MQYDIKIIYRDGNTEKTIADSYSILNGCLRIYKRFGIDRGDRYIPLDQISEWKVKL